VPAKVLTVIEPTPNALHAKIMLPTKTRQIEFVFVVGNNLHVEIASRWNAFGCRNAIYALCKSLLGVGESSIKKRNEGTNDCKHNDYY